MLKIFPWCIKAVLVFDVKDCAEGHGRGDGWGLRSVRHGIGFYMTMSLFVTEIDLHIAQDAGNIRINWQTRFLMEFSRAKIKAMLRASKMAMADLVKASDRSDFGNPTLAWERHRKANKDAPKPLEQPLVRLKISESQPQFPR